MRIKPRRRKDAKTINVTIIGFGKVGSHLYYALKETGRYRIHVIKNSKSFKSLKEHAEYINKSDIIFITTQDSKIGGAVKRLGNKPINLRGKYVYHTSGVLTSDVLMTLRKRGAETGSLHPVQTFESTTKERGYVSRFKNIYTVVEGTKGAVSWAIEISRDLESRHVTIDKRDKILHHICCVISSNYLLGLVHKLDEFKDKMKSIKLATDRSGRIRKNGFNKHGFFSIYEPLIRQTIENVKSKGTVKSLTGPIERNDVLTLKLHLKELHKKFPEFIPFYKFLGKETAKIALMKGSADKKALSKLFKVLEN